MYCRCIVYYSTVSGSYLLLEVGVMNETNKPGDTMSVALRTHHFVQATKEKVVSICKYSYYPLANEVAKGYSTASVRPSVTSL